MNCSHKIRYVLFYKLPVTRFNLTHVHNHIYFIGAIFYRFIRFKNFTLCSCCSQRKTYYCAYFYAASAKFLIT